MQIDVWKQVKLTNVPRKRWKEFILSELKDPKKYKKPNFRKSLSKNLSIEIINEEC